MKLRRTIVVVSCVVLILGSVFIWHFVHSELNHRQLAKDATALRIRAEQRDAEAQFKLGSIYFKGKGVPKDFVEAVRWYRKSAEQGYAKAEYSLSDMYRGGKGVPQDYREAERWCRKAAEKGDPRAQVGLGYLYYRGEGVPQDYAEAARWYRKSAEQGDADAQYDLGYMYYYGYGVSQDRVEADRLFHQAAARGSEDARRFLGSRRPRIPAMSKFVIAFEFLASLFFGVLFLKSEESLRSRAQIVTGVATLLLISGFGLDVFWYFYVSHLHSSTAVTALYFLRHLVAGLIIAVLVSVVHPKSAKAVLIAAAVLFIAFILFQIIRSELRHIPLTIRLLCFLGLPIGMSIPSVIFRWLDAKGNGLNGNDGTTVPVVPK